MATTSAGTRSPAPVSAPLHRFVEHVMGMPVSLALRGRETSHVEAGLKAGERYVAEGALLLNAEMASHAR